MDIDPWQLPGSPIMTRFTRASVQRTAAGLEFGGYESSKATTVNGSQLPQSMGPT